jgi:hypothetical protein
MSKINMHVTDHLAIIRQSQVIYGVTGLAAPKKYGFGGSNLL